MPDLLIELFSEEIPARMQTRAAADLKKLVTDGLVEAGLTYAHAAAFSTPRRLTLAVEGMSETAYSKAVEKKGPPINAPRKAIEGFLGNYGIEGPPSIIDEFIETLSSGEIISSSTLYIRTKEVKGRQILFAVDDIPVRPAAEIVAEVLEQTIRDFPWPKSMRWGAGTLRWVRPLHSILCLITDEAGAEVVPLTVDGIAAGRTTRGHRFMAPDAFSVTGFEDYAARLKRAFVVLDAAERAQAIWHDATNLAFAQGLEVVEDAGLLAEVAGLVEWPVVLMGPIADAFLDLPPEVLQTSMREHQKFFSVRNPKTGRIEKFITVANRITADDGATILAGNEKVLGARLSDAKFFWENDLRVATSDDGMETWVKALGNVTFHNKLGTQAELIERMATLAREIAPMVGADPDEAEQAARIAKADLSSEMVYEFPELQGLMGSYYARHANYSDAVANAAKEHYAPLGPSDDVPTAPVSVAVALAEKIDKLVWLWASGDKPTGSKDPFALRRAALGLIRILIENHVTVPVEGFFVEAIWNYLSGIDNHYGSIVALGPERLGEKADGEGWEGVRGREYRHIRSPENLDEISLEEGEVEFGVFSFDLHGESGFEVIEFYKTLRMRLTNVTEVAPDLLAFLHDRLKVYLRDQGIRHDIIDACLSTPDSAPSGATPGNDDLTLLVKRARALSETLKTDDGENLIQGFKRANNILTAEEAKDGVEYSFGADPKFAETDEERALFLALDEAEAKIKPAMEQQDFTTAMSAMAALRGPIDAFFDAVQVNAENPTVRRNRLNLLSRIRQICTSVADLTKIEG